KAGDPVVDDEQIEEERNSTYEPVKSTTGVGWKEMNGAVSRIMQSYCGEFKSDELLREGLKMLENLKNTKSNEMFARNPHELVRVLEVRNIMTNAEIVLNSCLARKASSKELHFNRLDHPEIDPPEWKKFLTVKLDNSDVQVSELPIDYYGDLEGNYEKYNEKYIKENR
ncbi:MAG: hypothetical protein GY863_08330, partial [bacterium]|nr:hypothetical protein [bacterium]